MSKDPYQSPAADTTLSRRKKKRTSSVLIGLVVTSVAFIGLGAMAYLSLSMSPPPATLPVTITPPPAQSATPPLQAEAPEESQSQPGTFTGKVIGVTDGDTIDVLTDEKETIRLRLNGIDCPERGQPFGNNATDYVKETIGGKMVRVVRFDTDRYGRVIADVYLPVADPRVILPDKFINRELVKAGLAWHYVEYSDDERLAADEVRARQKVAGLWSGSHKIFAPWDWRKLSKVERDLYR